MELLSVLSRSLGLSEDSFEEVFHEPLVVQRLMHYPAKANLTSADPAELGCGAHYDFGGLTILRQSDVPGLEVQVPVVLSNGTGSVKVEGGAYSTTSGTFYSDLQNYHANEWTKVDAKPDLLVVTFGEAMQRLTNGRVQATRHRVVHTGETARHSMAIFVDPNPYREVSPLPALVQESPLYAPRVAGHKTVLLTAAMGGYLGFGKV
jgi:isopenicillin N synthase-like dioxygenase